MAGSCPFDGKTALLFGGAKGIGRAVALEWARRGARLAVADIDQAAADATAAEIVTAGGQAIGLAADVLSEASVAGAANAAESALGPVDILMNNVGGMLNGNPQDVPFAEWQRIMDLNYFATVRGMAHFVPRMLARGRGHIVNTASFAGLYPYAASRIPYAAAKAAVIAMTENYAIYLEPLGIRVSCLIPGPVATGVRDTMTSWTPALPVRGPSSELTLKQPDEVAVKLADGMQAGEILISSDDVVWNIVKRWAAAPDDYIRARIAEFAAGETGRPQMPR
jgi:NAD(P)-dependent dehydrogenase (short-subunit alcohol dehydrogenase family)